MVLVARADKIFGKSLMSFDRLASHYRWMEAILAGGLLQRCRMRWLPEVLDARHVLLAGEGNGRMIEACALALPECHFTVIDQSEAMLVQARRRWQRAGGGQNTVFQCADLREWNGGEARYDLVITNFFFDCFAQDELHHVIANINAALSPQARWLVADFSMPPAGWRRIRAQMVLALAYIFFRFTTGISANRIHAPDEMLGAAGFTLRGREQFNHGLLHADLWTREK